MTIGSLWLPSDLRVDLKQKISKLRKAHNKHGEIKWSKISPSSIEFYKELIDLFMSYGKEVRFRCIAVEADKIDWDIHGEDRELGFYKFYYQMLHHWILDFNKYSIFCDHKTNRVKNELHVLKKCLSSSNISSEIMQVQALYSKQNVLIQLTDLLLGLASGRINNTIQQDGAKDNLIRHLEKKLDLDKLQPTPKYEQKFNIFKINLDGGW